MAVGIGIVCAIIAFLVSAFVIPASYTATVTMQVQPGVVPDKLPSDPTYSVTLAQTYAAIAQEHSTTSQAYALAGANPNNLPSTTCQASPLTALFSCSVTASSKLLSAHAANQLAATFIKTQSGWLQHQYWGVSVTNPAQIPTGASSPHATLDAVAVLVIVAVVCFGFGWLETRYPAWRRNLI